MNFIDIHCHIIPGIDDGADDLNEALKMLEIAVNDGISHIFATPHIMSGVYDNQAVAIRQAVEAFQKHIPASMKLLHGADVRISHDLLKRIENKEIVTLMDSGYLLFEFPEFAVPPNVDNMIFNLKQRGITPIITHPERHMRLMRDHEMLRDFLSTGALCQITAMSVTGDFGREIKKFSMSMLDKGLVDFIASDAHDTKKRPPILSKAYKEVKKHFGEAAADTIFFHNPNKILAAGGKYGTKQNAS